MTHVGRGATVAGMDLHSFLERFFGSSRLLVKPGGAVLGGRVGSGMGSVLSGLHCDPSHDTLFVHSNGHTFEIYVVGATGGREVQFGVPNVARYVRALENSGYFTRGKSLRLYACYSGRHSLAQELANALGREVLAPTGIGVNSCLGWTMDSFVMWLFCSHWTRFQPAR